MEQIETGRRTHCIRCGDCCLSSTPSLQKEDISLLGDGRISNDSLYTIRAGELVWDNIFGEFKTVDNEIIKVRERPEGGCFYYEKRSSSCTIYEHRPIQCAAMACWDESEFLRVYDGPKAERQDIVHENMLLHLIEEHEERCSYLKLHKYARDIKEKGEEAVQGILELLKFDYHFRPFVSNRLGININNMDLFFGRPLVKTVEMFGLKVIREPDGSFLLTML